MENEAICYLKSSIISHQNVNIHFQVTTRKNLATGLHMEEQHYAVTYNMSRAAESLWVTRGSHPLPSKGVQNFEAITGT